MEAYGEARPNPTELRDGLNVRKSHSTNPIFSLSFLGSGFAIEKENDV